MGSRENEPLKLGFKINAEPFQLLGSLNRLFLSIVRSLCPLSLTVPPLFSNRLDGGQHVAQAHVAEDCPYDEDPPHAPRRK